MLSAMRNLPRARRLLSTAVKASSTLRASARAYEGPLATKARLNQRVVEAKYAVRGPLATLADELKAQLDSGAKLPFDRIYYANIGNPQSLGHKPLTFPRQVLAAALYPEIRDMFPRDVAERASAFNDEKQACMSLGQYSESKGLLFTRKRVAEALERRDGVPADEECIYLTDGASKGVEAIIQLMLRGSNDGALVPIPQYPLYSASLKKFDGQLVKYMLNEKKNWALEIDKLKAAVVEARQRNVDVRAIVVINPGNPTGQSLSRDNVEGIVHLAEEENLLIMADEVYQDNIYDPSKQFVSFKKVVREMDSPVQLVSFHSTSKGLFGECGLRGGYMEIVNFPEDTEKVLTMQVSISLCANLAGQVTLDCMMNPPQPGDPSYATFKEECEKRHDSFKRVGEKLHQTFNSLEGVSCNKAEGAMYLFPEIAFPPRSIDMAAQLGVPRDHMYCTELLENKGICLVDGSGFGQEKGTYHVRSTVLIPEKDIVDFTSKIEAFHVDFLNRYS